MKSVAYYLVLLANTVTCWSCVRNSASPWRIIWSLTTLAVVSFPAWLAAPVAFYYALLLNVTMFFSSADTYMGKGIRRFRGIVGGILLSPVPIIFQQIQTSWSVSFLVPTLGHLVVSGVSWPIFARLLVIVENRNTALI